MQDLFERVITAKELQEKEDFKVFKKTGEHRKSKRIC